MTQWGLDTLFNPAKRHMDEEKRRLQSTREEIGDNSGGKRIDFDSGKVVIRRATEDGSTDDATNNDGADAADGATPAADRPAGTPAGKRRETAPSAAAIRAAKRRGREPR